MDRLYVVVPCYNEEEVLPETAKRLRAKLLDLIRAGKISPDSRVMFINDGSKDRTWEMIGSLHNADRLFEGVCLSRNRGHQNALMAGLMTARAYADMVISMDADLQDDIDAVDAMVEKYSEGCDIVYGVRSSRTKDSIFKRGTAQLFYRLLSRLGGEVVYNHADYRLMSRRALDALSEYGEVNLFLRGVVPMLGYKTATVEYERGERFAGESKYPLRKMLALSMDGITGLSMKPVEFIFWAGCVLTVFSVALLLIFLIMAVFGLDFNGWRLVLFAVFLVGGLQLMGLGIVGEYVGKTYMETKHRPRYHISEILHSYDA